jgi:hypothetical protein
MEELIAPLLTFIEWSKSYQIVLAGIHFTFFDVWLYTIVVGIVLGFILNFYER